LISVEVSYIYIDSKEKNNKEARLLATNVIQFLFDDSSDKHNELANFHLIKYDEKKQNFSLNRNKT